MRPICAFVRALPHRLRWALTLLLLPIAVIIGCAGALKAALHDALIEFSTTMGIEVAGGWSTLRAAATRLWSAMINGRAEL